MDVKIPEEFLQVTKASTSDILEDGNTLIALCMTNGQLLELVDNKVTESCDVDMVADNIVTFTSYEPVQKYYMLRCQEHLIVVKRSRPLCVIKTYNNIVDVNIEDRLRIGRPQVVIKTQNDTEPIITDFVGQLHSSSPQVVPQLTASLSGKLQAMNARVAKARRLLQENRTARDKALYHFTPHLQLTSETECEPQVLVWGPPPPSQPPPADPPLVISRTWRKVHNGKWIIGLSVFNSTNNPVHNIRLRLQLSCGGESEPRLQYSSLVVGLPQRGTSGAEWTEPRKAPALPRTLTEIGGRTSAVVVGLLEEPLLKKSSVVSISGAIVYKHNLQSHDIQDLLGEIQFKVEDLIQGSIVPFSPQDTPDESDLISVIVGSQCWCLHVSARHRMAPPLTAALAQVGLVQVRELGCWVAPGLGGGSLVGLLVICEDLTLHVYAREMKQVLHLVHSLQGQWKVEVCRDGAASAQDCISSLRAELCALHSIARPGAEYTASEWSEIREKLNKLELTTDSTFASRLAK